MLDVPIRYARSGTVEIAYRTLGDGPIDVVFVQGWLTHLQVLSEEPAYRRFCEGLSGFCRLILFDKRGMGLSDRTEVGTLEDRIDDVRAILDDVGSERAVLLGVSEGGPMSLLFAATHPDRTQALVLCGGEVKEERSADWPWGEATREEHRASMARMSANWPIGTMIDHVWPSARGDEQRYAWMRRLQIAAATPRVAVAFMDMAFGIDVRAVAPVVNVPTLILHSPHDQVCHVENARFLARTIPGAEYTELTGNDHVPWGDCLDEIVAGIREFLTGRREAPEPDRALATILFTDIVDSTRRAAELGDARWRDLLQRHHDTVRQQLLRFRGRELDTAGDGFFASFDGPARAIRCAQAAVDAVHSLGIDIRAGVHTGECELIGNKLGGIAVHIGARVAAAADAGEVLVSSTVRDLVAGSSIQFENRGEHQLKGIAGAWRLFAVVPASRSGEPSPTSPSSSAVLLAGLDSVSLSQYAVVGHYMRFDETIRNRLKDVRDSVEMSLVDPGARRNVYLIHAAPGSGKTYLVTETAASLSGVRLQEINLARTDEASFAEELRAAATTTHRQMCLVDECDAKQEMGWPYELLLPTLDEALTRRSPVVFVLAGSSGHDLEEFRQRIASRPKGADLLSRIPAENVISIEPMGVGDRLLIALSNIVAASSRLGRQMKAVEKMGLLFLLLDPELTTPRQLQEFVLRAVERVHPAEDRLKYDHLFNRGDPKNKAFWTRWQAHHWALSERFLAVVA